MPASNLAGGGASARVLIADDDLFCRAFVTMRVATLDASIVEVSDGAAALAALLESRFDAAIIDLEMPKLDGFGLIGCIRANERLKHLPIIVLSGHTDKISMERALAAGATSYLTKPLHWGAFGEHIRSVLTLGVVMHAEADRLGGKPTSVSMGGVSGMRSTSKI